MLLWSDETVILAAADRGLGDQLGIFPVDQLANGLDMGGGHPSLEITAKAIKYSPFGPP